MNKQQGLIVAQTLNGIGIGCSISTGLVIFSANPSKRLTTTMVVIGILAIGSAYYIKKKNS